ncbi:MAG: hypothetical protein ACK4UJ_11140 [Leptonema sp. (in: bacteria)]
MRFKSYYHYNGFFQYYPDIKKFFDNFQITAKVYNNKLEKKLNSIYEKNLHYEFFTKNLIVIDAIIKELVQNAMKANIKRWVIKRYALNPLNEIDYKKSLRIFKHILYFIKIEEFEKKISDFDFYFCIYFSFHSKVLILHVLNEGYLFPQEEARIRKKFLESREIKNVYDYYSHFSDTEEGAGMGIAMIVMLLKQIGLDHRNFLIFNTNYQEKNWIVSRVFIPMDLNYKIPRKKFEILLKNSNENSESLRKKIQNQTLYIPFL